MVVVFGISSLWLKPLKEDECWLAVVSKEAAGTVSLREGILEVEGESDFTAEPVAPRNKKRFPLIKNQGHYLWVNKNYNFYSTQLLKKKKELFTENNFLISGN